MRKPTKFPEGKIFHICNKSIAGFKIFGNLQNSLRFFQTFNYYNSAETITNLGIFLVKNKSYQPDVFTTNPNQLIKVLAYCIMPDHYHLLVKIIQANRLPKYMNNIESSYTRFFNIKYNRKGPLWQSDYKVINVRTNEQLLHVSRYIHLNPTTAGLANKPEDWFYSSYKDYIYREEILINYLSEISIKTGFTYQKFAENNIDYQKKLGRIKKLFLD